MQNGAAVLAESHGSHRLNGVMEAQNGDLVYPTAGDQPALIVLPVLIQQSHERSGLHTDEAASSPSPLSGCMICPTVTSGLG
jgi:hypothetical protein